jgi:hypothetical protein
MRKKLSYAQKCLLKISEPIFKKRIVFRDSDFTERGLKYKTRPLISNINFRMRSDGALLCYLDTEKIDVVLSGSNIFKFKNNIKLTRISNISFKTLKVKDEDGLSIYLKGIDIGWSANKELLLKTLFLNAFEVKMLRATRDSWRAKINKGDYSGFE